MSIPNDRIAANAALLRLFKNQYRESSDRHSDALFVRDHFDVLEAENVKLRYSLERSLTAINAGFGKAQRDHIIAEGRKLLA